MTATRGLGVVRNMGLNQRLELVAIALGALTFIWGFLDWWGAGGESLNGYRLTDGYVPIALTLAASLVASINLRAADRSERIALLAIGLSGLGVLFTIVAMAVKPALVVFVEELANQFGNSRVSVSIQVGLILTLVSAILQLGCLVVSWLFETGRMAINPKAPAVPTTPSEPGATTVPTTQSEPSAPIVPPPPPPPPASG